MQTILKFKKSLGPSLEESFDRLLIEMVQDGAPAKVAQIEEELEKLKKEIDRINSQRQLFSESKAMLECICRKLDRFINKTNINSSDLLMLKVFLKDRIKQLDIQIKESRPNTLLKEKALLRDYRDFLLENREIGYSLLKDLKNGKT